VICYELMIGVTPFYNRNRNTMLEKIKKSRAIFPDPKLYNFSVSTVGQDFIFKLLEK